MNKRHVWVIFMMAFEGQRGDRSGMISVGRELHMPTLKVVHLNFSFEASDEHRDDSAQDGCVADQRHQVRDESITCIDSQRIQVRGSSTNHHELRILTGSHFLHAHALLPQYRRSNHCHSLLLCNLDQLLTARIPEVIKRVRVPARWPMKNVPISRVKESEIATNARLATPRCDCIRVLQYCLAQLGGWKSSQFVEIRHLGYLPQDTISPARSRHLCVNIREEFRRVCGPIAQS